MPVVPSGVRRGGGAPAPGPDGETFLEVQTTFRPTAESLEFGKSNFGFFAVRVSKAISAFFGGGTLTNSAGATGEPRGISDSCVVSRIAAVSAAIAR